MTRRDLTYLRAQLASVGILLAAPTPLPPRGGLAAAAPLVDRKLVRAILADAGAPLIDLEWLVASCPSVDDALSYQPPREGSWFAGGEIRVLRERSAQNNRSAPARSPRLGEPTTWPRGGW